MEVLHGGLLTEIMTMTTKQTEKVEMTHAGAMRGEENPKPLFDKSVRSMRLQGQ